ncbi:hypothetical protein TELCIR_01148 [Teladorsagia circumcincta]|uniref:Uncharacterized protein n=1 Tax=Teladorsagia circumcincta TaxID=45464 RepID=A0A2G9V2Q3_TELCI|nr:hypothetical protein TELCIR_01148 [Teladorsagia circumcincta]
MIRQCTCQEFEPCKNRATGNIMQCSDQCQSHLTAMGGSYPAIRQCIQAKEPMIRGVIGCQSNQLSGACARGPGGKVPKRYPETLKLAAYSEINSMLAKSGIQAEARSFMAGGKKFATCIEKCMDRGTGGCFKKLKFVLVCMAAVWLSHLTTCLSRLLNNAPSDKVSTHQQFNKYAAALLMPVSEVLLHFAQGSKSHKKLCLLKIDIKRTTEGG